MSKLSAIKYWAEDQRPRERLIQNGKGSLSKAELIAILIGTGTKELSALDLANAILQMAKHNLNALGKLSIADLCQIKGIGEAKAISIVAAIELGRRRLLETSMEQPKIQSSQTIFNLLHPHLQDLTHEEFWCIYLNNNLKIIELKRISTGNIDATLADVRLIFKQAIILGATHLAVAHNHPSGNCNPSNADNLLTKKIQQSGEILSISLIDHLIISENSYFSYADSHQL